MEFDIGVIRRHPYLLGGIVLIVGGYIFYRIYKGSAGPSELSSEAQFQQLQSAQQLAQAQYQSQVDLANAQSDAQIAVINASYGGQIGLAKQGQAVYDDYLATQIALAEGANKTTVDVAQIQSGTAIATTQLQTDVYQSYLANQAMALYFANGLADKSLTKYLSVCENCNPVGILATLGGAFQGILSGGTPGAAAVAATAQLNAASKSFVGVSIPGIGSVQVGG